MRKLLLLVSFVCCSSWAVAQEGILYQTPLDHNHYQLGVGSYGRTGVHWNFEEGGSIGRRLNLNNMGSIGGRMEEQDYAEMGVAFRYFVDQDKRDSLDTQVNVQFRTSVYNTSATGFYNVSTASIGGLVVSLPEMYAEAKNILVPNLNLWVGARLYRGPDVHMADHWYFNDHSGQGFGVEYKKSRLHVNFITSTDTSAALPDYFYINIKTGTPSLELREKIVTSFEHDIQLNQKHGLVLLGEYHYMPDPGPLDIQTDTSNIYYEYPSDFGYVAGIKHQWGLDEEIGAGSFQHFSIRYGGRLANGGDGGMSQTHRTFGAPDTLTNSFERAYSLAIVDHFLLNFSPKFSLNGYLIYTQSKGAAATDHLATTYLGKQVFNRKEDFSIGVKGVNYITDVFHWQTELHYSSRKDGLNPWANMVKLSLVPTLAIKGEKSVWSRPHLRFVTSIARYNDYAKDNLYSPYLQIAGNKQFGYYFGIKAEWWTW